MSNPIFKHTFPCLQIVKDSVQIVSNEQSHKMSMLVHSNKEEIGNAQVLEMLEQVLLERKSTGLVIGCQRPRNSFCIDLRDVVLIINSVSLTEDGFIKVESSYVPQYETILTSGTLDNGHGIIVPTLRVFGVDKYQLATLHFSLAPIGANVVLRNSSNRNN